MLREPIYALFSIIFISKFGAYSTQNQCTPWTAINITLEDIAGRWYVIAYLNETNPDELNQRCITQLHDYKPEQNAIEESRTSTSTITGETQTVYNTFTFATPGFINTTTDNNGTLVSYFNRFLEYSPGDSFIFSNCLSINGSMYTDRLSLFMSRQHVSLRTIRRKFATIGIPLNDDNILFRIQQKNCSYT